jgi:hypothetical protein
MLYRFSYTIALAYEKSKCLGVIEASDSLTVLDDENLS